MRFQILFLLLFCLTISLHAQVDTKYLKGAVPVVDSKVVFTKAIEVNGSISEEQLFDLMSKWAKDNYNKNDGSKNKVLLLNPDKNDIACQGEHKLVFKKSAFSVDQAIMTYQLLLNIQPDRCIATIRAIKYDYSPEKNLLTAEEMITDKVALKNDDKLQRNNDKFRIFTIDYVNNIFESIDIYLNGINSKGAAQNIETTANGYQSTTSISDPIKHDPAIQNKDTMHGYKSVSADKIPGNIIKLLNDRILIVSGVEGRQSVMTSSWGGIGVFGEKPVSFCFMNSTRYSAETMNDGDIYTITFYTEAYKDAMRYFDTNREDANQIGKSGLTPIKTPSEATAFAEAWMILECKKIVQQPIQRTAVNLEPDNAASNKDGYDMLYIGEIVNVWIK